MNISVLISTMIQLFLLLLVGYILNKCHIFDTHTNKKISAFIVNVTSPLLVVYSVTTVSSPNRLYVFKLIGAGILMYIGFIIIGKIVSRILPIDKKDRTIYELLCIFANTGFMGYPVLLSLFDYEAVFIASMIHLPFSLFIYTYGVYALSKEGSGEYSFNIKSLLTPGLIITLLAVVLYVSQLQLPTTIVNTINSIGGLTSPLSMMMIGSSLANYPLLESITDYKSYLFSIVRLFVIPTITMLVCKVLAVPTLISSVCIITNAMPVASMTLMLATQYDANVQVVTKNIIVTTALSVITIPIIVMLYV